MVDAPHRAIRYRCELIAKLLLDSGAKPTARVLEISASGAFLETDLKLTPGQKLHLSLPLPDGDPWLVTCTVVRAGRKPRELQHARVENVTVSRSGFAVSFDAVSDEIAPRLKSYLDRLDER
jgi:hypothetical protein